MLAASDNFLAREPVGWWNGTESFYNALDRPHKIFKHMPTTLEQYREAKSSYLKLRNHAKKELIARFNELSAELLQVQRELLEDFGEKVAIPSKSKKPKASKKPAEPATAPVAAPPAAPSPKVAALQKQVDTQKKKLADARSANKPTKVIEDRIYELEDSIRLSLEG
jgi:hypothetical protein